MYPTWNHKFWLTCIKGRDIYQIVSSPSSPFKLIPLATTESGTYKTFRILDLYLALKYCYIPLGNMVHFAEIRIRLLSCCTFLILDSTSELKYFPHIASTSYNCRSKSRSFRDCLAIYMDLKEILLSEPGLLLVYRSTQRRLRSACAPTQSDRSLCSALWG